MKSRRRSFSQCNPVLSPRWFGFISENLENCVFSFMLYRLVVGNLSLSGRTNRSSRSFSPIISRQTRKRGIFSKKFAKEGVWIIQRNTFFFFSRRIFIHGESFFYYLVLFYMCVRFFFFIKSDELRIFRDTMRLAKRVEMCMHRCCKHGIIIGEM